MEKKGAQSMLQLEPSHTWNLDMRSSPVYLAVRRDEGFRRICAAFFGLRPRGRRVPVALTPGVISGVGPLN